MMKNATSGRNVRKPGKRGGRLCFKVRFVKNLKKENLCAKLQMNWKQKKAKSDG